MIEKYRDIQLIEKDAHHYLAIACDVSASIGPKENDLVKVTGEIAGYYAAAVPIIELLAIGAIPISVVDTLGVEMQGIGEHVIEGIREAMREGDVDPMCLTGSTEDNIPTTSTTVGVTVIAQLNKDLLEAYKPRVGQGVYVVGKPKVGQVYLEEEIIGHMGEVLKIATVKGTRHEPHIGHILPIGSKGIAYELSVLLETFQLAVEPTSPVGIDLMASAGPAACMLVTCDSIGEAYLREKVRLPVTYLGKLKKR